MCQPCAHSQGTSHMDPFPTASNSTPTPTPPSFNKCTESFSLNQNNFEAILAAVDANPSIKHIYVEYETLSKEQRVALSTFVVAHKGLRLSDKTATLRLYLNYQRYNEEKRYAYRDRGMHPVTREALTRFQEVFGRLPNQVTDFGAGTGQDTVCLAMAGCTHICAIDSDSEAVGILQNNLRNENLSEVECITGPFLEAEIPSDVELFVSSYTVPYRCPEIFPRCWKKCVDSIAPGGYFSGHFFGPITGVEPDPNVTYHTEKQLRALLLPDFYDVLIAIEPEGSKFTLYGGDTPEWGALYHVVARKRAANSV